MEDIKATMQVALPKTQARLYRYGQLISAWRNNAITAIYHIGFYSIAIFIIFNVRLLVFCSVRMFINHICYHLSKSKIPIFIPSIACAVRIQSFKNFTSILEEMRQPSFIIVIIHKSLCITFRCSCYRGNRSSLVIKELRQTVLWSILQTMYAYEPSENRTESYSINPQGFIKESSLLALLDVFCSCLK